MLGAKPTSAETRPTTLLPGIKARTHDVPKSDDASAATMAQTRSAVVFASAWMTAASSPILKD